LWPLFTNILLPTYVREELYNAPTDELLGPVLPVKVAYVKLTGGSPLRKLTTAPPSESVAALFAKVTFTNVDGPLLLGTYTPAP
jgi:hypothetical protein